MTTSQSNNNTQQSSYLIDAATTAINGANQTPILCDIKILCTQRKKKSKHYIYLTFIESCSLSLNDQPCIEIINKPNSSSILLNDCISYEYFDEIKNDFQSFIYIYFQSYTISIYFSDENLHKKSLIIKHLEYMSNQKTDKSTEINNQQSTQEELPCLTSTEHILHTFDIKLIPYETILTRDHILLGRARIYFTTTDLYIASIDCNRIDLKSTVTNQCPSKDKNILCIPYFTINHYGNRSNIFLIELGKSNYGNGEIHMKCNLSSLASTIHLLVSPVIEERPLILSSAFHNQLLTKKRIEKSKYIHPPIQLNHDITIQSLPFSKKSSIESLSDQSITTRSLFGFFRKLVKNKKSLERSSTFDSSQNQQSSISPTSLNKFFELNINEKKISNNQNDIILPKSQKISLTTSSNKQETTMGTYIDMGPTNQNQQEEIKDEEIIKEPTRTVDIGVNTMISISPHIHSVIIVGTSVHLIAEERSVFPIGQRSFTSPASIMQPFKAQLTANDMKTCVSPTSSNSFHQSLLLSYSIVTFNKNQTDLLSDGSTIDRRLNSDLSLMSLSHQRQPSNIYSFDNILSSSSSSQIFRTLSLSTNNIGDNTSAPIRTSNGSIIFFDENSSDQSTTTTYLLGSPSTTLISDTNLPIPISRPYLSHINEEKVSSDDSYALIEPLNLQNSSLLSSPKLPLISEKSVNYTDLLLPLNTGDEQQEFNSSDDNINDLIEEKTERSATIFYTDIDFHQTQRRDRIAQFAAISKTNDQIPPFVL